MNEIKELRALEKNRCFIEISFKLLEVKKTMLISLIINEPVTVLDIKQYISKDFGFSQKDMILFYPLIGILDNDYEFKYQQQQTISLELFLHKSLIQKEKPKTNIVIECKNILDNFVSKPKNLTNKNNKLINYKDNINFDNIKNNNKNNKNEILINKNINVLKENVNNNTTTNNNNKNIQKISDVNIKNTNKINAQKEIIEFDVHKINQITPVTAKKEKNKSEKLSFILTKVETETKKVNDIIINNSTNSKTSNSTNQNLINKTEEKNKKIFTSIDQNKLLGQKRKITNPPFKTIIPTQIIGSDNKKQNEKNGPLFINRTINCQNNVENNGAKKESSISSNINNSTKKGIFSTNIFVVSQIVK